MKKTLFYFFIILILFCQSNLAIAAEYSLYSIQNAKLEQVKGEFEYFLNKKNYLIVSKDVNNGIYCIKPKYMGAYNLEKYLIILKQDGNDTLLYTSANMSNLRTTQLIVKYLKSKGLNPIYYSEKKLDAALKSYGERYQLNVYKSVALAKLDKQNNAKHVARAITKPNQKDVYLYAPKWNEFCPSQFVDAEYQEIYAYKPSHKANMWALTIVGIPYVWYEQAQHQSKMMYLSVSNYWVQRREIFENEIQTCLADEQNATTCFMQIRQLENSKNAELRQEELARQQMALQARINTQNSIQSTIQSQQLNNSINNLNYGLNNINTNLMMMQMNRR